MLCPACRRQLERGASWCGACGAPVGGAAAPLELVLADLTRVPLVADVTLGRAPGSTVVLSDPSVSRVHARISAGNGEGVVLEDAGSSHGTYLDGVRVTGPVPLHDGAKIRLGDSELAVERRRDGAEAGRTLVVRAGATALVPAAAGMHPRVRSGYALKRLDASEGSRRWILRDLQSGTFLRLSDSDAQLFEQLDGTRSLSELVADAEARFGATGPARLARLLADLGERGWLVGVQSGAAGMVEEPQSLARRLLRPREKSWRGVGRLVDAVYRGGGWMLVTRPALYVLGLLAVAGVGVFAYLVAGRYGTPFVVARKIGLGGLVFLLGRFAVVVVHELAHGLVMASYGRRIDRAGLKLLVIFPYAFVDTSEAWFEPRRRRIAVSAAGPASDFTLGAIFSICCLVLDPGTVRDIFFQLAFAAYVGACFNLNPFLDRDGYHILVDVLREPGLRRRAREQFSRRLAGRPSSGDSPVLARYSAFGLLWSVLAALFAIAMTLHYRAVLEAIAPAEWIVWVVMATVWVAVFVPVLVVVGRPLAQRYRGED
ncbi:MAG TPA: FHA domain-containing protein [Solirubrobacteraceae bacterium]|nr:FHA domain-containing protein [Solirubrobacteraceae bacterium]